jgi:Capsular polysaccharide biosynthesis protein
MVIDLHTHILPGVDDGAKDIADSLAMAEVAVKDGISTMIATPHVVKGIYDNNKNSILEGVDNLNKKLAAHNIGLLVLPGAEYRLEPDLPKNLASGELVTINNSGTYLLIELPYELIPDNCDQILYEIQLQGVTPIIAHPERNLVFRKYRSLLERYIKRGMLAQITSTSITGFFGKRVKKAAISFLESGLAHIIASDGHAVKGRAPVISEAYQEIERRWGTQYAQSLAFENPHRIIMSQRVPVSTPPPQQSFWKRFYI